MVPSLVPSLWLAYTTDYCDGNKDYCSECTNIQLINCMSRCICPYTPGIPGIYSQRCILMKMTMYTTIYITKGHRNLQNLEMIVQVCACVINCC